MKKKLAVGGENFPSMIRKNCYYVDKTGFIRAVMKSERRVLVVTRPRRFGKTLFMDTLKSFLQVDFANPGAETKNAALLSGLAVMQLRDFCAALWASTRSFRFLLKAWKAQVTRKPIDGWRGK